ncbi:ribosome small subunit-dependent GTPase A [Alkalihalobacillus sp. LMS39]|uniref:ribosome small subunit-dependent GTPase A n=1 Tax=Alkalihalobacillus sp. LMS39 TaxID=2924032 RepID=UPI001FB5512D|nr:ribosome small subunit-dependent GTPase A [Alkalihalobacillus sp. LMS39]UOE92885.1 ribosome small subunit-dependent GTPase A [Alkalihalobacillus sp. LMS39]
MAKGKIIKALSGFYYVKNDDGVFQCRGRGNFRNRNIKPLVGDIVEFEAENKTDGYILEVFERENEMVRPPIANVEQAILVFSAQEPEFSPLLLNRFLVHIEAHHIIPIICISKVDLLTEEKKHEILNYKADYEKIGYEVVLISSKKKEGLELIKSLFDDKISVIAGQSGVGKSSLLNAINPELLIETNEISTHLGRGKHTTRHVELIPIGTGLVADTPGFSSLDFTTIEADDLSLYFPEMKKEMGNCKFRGCTHTSEPKCAVKAALENGEIAQYRYDHYLEFLEEIKSMKRRY